jgi:hypothetical protein
MRGVDTKVYWNWSRKDNNSTQITFTPVAGSNLLCSGGPCTTELFNYKKNNFGVEGGYRFNPENRVVAGFDYLYANRERIDFIRNIDRKYSLEWKNSSFDTLDTRAKYQYLTRSSNFVDTGNFDQFQRRFDLQSVNQNLAKLAFDYTPRPLLDFGLELLYKNNDYTGDRPWLQRTKDKREEIYGSVGFGDPKSFRMLMFVDAELIQYDSLHRAGAVPASGDPTAPPAARQTPATRGARKTATMRTKSVWAPIGCPPSAGTSKVRRSGRRPTAARILPRRPAPYCNRPGWCPSLISITLTGRRLT